jgi:3-hydroxyisobutyrate dehydrogenase
MADRPSGTVAFWGLGNMGFPMTVRLLEAGVAVRGFDLSPVARERFAAAGGTLADPGDPADADTLVLMLPNSDVVEHVLLTDGLAAALRPGTRIIDMSSSEPLRTQDLAARLAADGLVLLDAPVSGGVSGAERGTLAIMVGGAEEDVAAVTPLLDHLGRPSRVGPVGAGHALKALNNLLSATHLWATSEAMLVGERFGLDPEVMLETINGSSGRSGSTQNKWPNFILPGGYDSGFGLQLMLKDMRIATGLAHRLGVPIALGDEVVAHWSRAAGDLPATADHTEVARYLEEESRSAASDPVR